MWQNFTPQIEFVNCTKYSLGNLIKTIPFWLTMKKIISRILKMSDENKQLV